MYNRNITGALKKIVTMIVAMMNTSLSQKISHPTQSSSKGQSPTISESHGTDKVMMHEMTIAISWSERDDRKAMKAEWFFVPTQLFNQGQ